MAIDPLQQIDPINETSVPQSPRFFDGQLPAVDAPVNELSMPEVNNQPVQNNLKDNETEVAGIGKELLKRIVTPIQDFGNAINNKGMDATKRGGVVEPLEEITEDGLGIVKNKAGTSKYFVAREAEQIDIDEFNFILGKTKGVPSPTPGQKRKGVPLSEINLNNIESADDVKIVLSKMGKMHGNTPNVTADDVKKLAGTHGFQDVIEKILKRKEGDAINMDLGEIYKSLQAITSSAVQLNRIAEKAASTNAGPEDLVKFRQYFAFHSSLQSSFKGLQADVGRALGVFKIPRGPQEAQIENLKNVINEFGGDQSIRNAAKQYLALPTQEMRNKFALKGFWARSGNVMMEIWINGLLSGFQTQVVNLAGNTVFAGMQPFERAIAGGIGALRRGSRNLGIVPPEKLRLTRKNLASNPETVFASEASDMISSYMAAFIDSSRIFGQALWRDQQMFDVLGKIENTHQQAITGKNFGLEDSAFAPAIDMLGHFIRIPGRTLMSTDEFFKAFNYRVELAAQIKRRLNQMHLDGASPDDIKKAEKELYLNPPEEVHGRADEMARINTFTKSIGGLPEQLRQGLHNTKVGRLAVPFFRVVYNIMDAAIERSPLGIYKVINSTDPIQRDLAIAKISMGSSILAATATWYASGQVTGTGPQNYDLRRQMEEMGWKQWSLVYPKKGIEKPRTVYVGQIPFLHPDDVDYVPYSRLEPVSMLLAIGADVGRRMMYPDVTQMESEQLAIQSVDAIYDYIKDQTVMQGFANIAEGFARGVPGTGDSKFIKNVTSSQIPYSTLLSNIARVTKADEPLKDTSSNPREPIILRDLYAGLRRMDERTPFSLGTDINEAPTKRNVFYEPIYRKNTRIVDQILPPGVQGVLGIDAEEIRTDPVKLEIIRLGLPVRMPPKDIKGVRLTPWERDAYNEFTNYGKKGSGQISLYEEINNIMNHKMWDKTPYADQQKDIKSVFTERRQDAVEFMLDPENENFAELQAKVAEHTTLKELYGDQVK